MNDFPKLPFLLTVLIILCVNTSVFAQQNGSPLEVPVIKDGQAQVIPELADTSNWIRQELWVETEFDSDDDGKLDRMHVDVTRPVQTDTENLKLPVIYETSPYYAGTASVNPKYFWDVRQELGAEPPERVHPPAIQRRNTRPIISNTHVETWVPRGFVVVHSSSPGTGYSEGSPTVGGDNESLAPKAVIDWLNGRATGYTTPDGDETVEAYWSTGQVGMTGTSYNGTLPIAAATTGVDGLEAIIPIAPNTSYYHYYRSHGLVRNPGGYQGEDIDVLFDFIHSDPDKREWAERVIRDQEMAQGMDRVTGDYNDFWAGRDYLNDLGPLKTPVLMAHAFNDWNVMPEHSYRIIKALKEKGIPLQIYYHQDGHGGPPPLQMMNRWFTRYLYDVENGVEDDPKAWIVRENDSRENPTPYADYPHPQAELVTFGLKGGAPQQGELLMGESADGGGGTETLVDNFSFSAVALAQAEWTQHRLMYLTPELKDSVHISGVPEITVRIASSKPAANLSIMLVSLPWQEGRYSQITDNIITRGWADLQNRNSLCKTEPLEPGQFYSMTFELQPDDQVIPAGQRIGLMIFSSDREFTLHPDPGTELTVDLAGTHLTLPVVGGRSALSFE